MTIRHTRIACWVLKATNTHSEYVILFDFPLQQRLQERTSMLRSTYIAYLVCYATRPDALDIPNAGIYLGEVRTYVFRRNVCSFQPH